MGRTRGQGLGDSRRVAFLRAINVGGRVVKMTALRRIFESAGFSGVETYIASGNVFFETAARNTEALERQIEAALLEALGYRSATLVRSPSELTELVRHSSMTADIGRGVTRYVGFTRNELSQSARRTVASFKNNINDFKVYKREVIWTCRVPFSQAKFSSATLEKALDTEATFRNATTVRAIAAKLSDRSNN